MPMIITITVHNNRFENRVDPKVGLTVGELMNERVEVATKLDEFIKKLRACLDVQTPFSVVCHITYLYNYKPLSLSLFISRLLMIRVVIVL